MLKAFREFAFKGNVVDLAVGVIIGAAFGRIVTAVVDDVIMPVVALLLPAGNWREAGLTLGRKLNPEFGPAHPAAPQYVPVKLLVGHLLGAAIDFLIVAFVLFLVVRVIVRKKAEPTPETRECPACLETIDKRARRCKHCTSELAALA